MFAVISSHVQIAGIWIEVIDKKLKGRFFLSKKIMRELRTLIQETIFTFYWSVS